MRKSETMRSAMVLMVVVCLVGCGSHTPPPTGNPPAPAKHPPAVPPMIAMPTDKRLYDRAREELKAAANSADELLRAHAIEELKQLHLPDSEAVIVSALNDRSPLVRKAAALSAGELQIHSVVDRLNESLETATGGDRIAIIFALHRLGDTSHSHDLEQTSIDADPRIRGDTALVLGMLGDRSSIAILIHLLKDPNRGVRLEAAEALWRLGNAKGLESLISATVSADPDERMIALLSLAEPRDTQVLGNVEGLLTDDEPAVALVAARATGMLGSDDGYGVVLNQVASPQPQLRVLSAIALGEIGRTDSQPILKKLLADSDPNVRLVAAGAILEIDQKH